MFTFPSLRAPRVKQTNTPRAPEDEAALREYGAKIVRQYGILVTGLLLVFTLLRWPLDLVLLADADRATMTSARLSGIAVLCLALIVFAWVKPRSRGASMTAMLSYAAFVGLSGYWYCRLGPEQAYVVKNFAVGVVPAALIPAELRIRALGTTCVALALYLAFELGSPSELPLALALERVTFFLFATLLTIVVGEASYRTTRVIFFERRDAQRTRQELAHLTDHLRTLVRERTEELRALAQHLESAQENERRRIARDLHDDLGQSVTAMRYSVESLRRELDDGDPALLLLDDLTAILDGTARTLRSVVATLSPRILEEHGLAAAARWLAQQIDDSGACVCTVCDDAVRDDAVPDDTEKAWESLDPRVALVAFRVLQEGTTNALKHASASRLELRLGLDERSVTVEVNDDGRGFAPSVPSAGFGLFGLRERVRNLGGQLDVESAPGTGTRLRGRIPRARPEDHDEAGA